MTLDPRSALTLNQQQALRLVAEGFETGEIAQQLGISEAAVVDRIERARRKFDGMPRKRLARLVVQADRGSPIPGWEASPPPIIGQKTAEIREFPGAATFGGVMEERAAFEPFPGLRRVAHLGGRSRSLLIVASAIAMLALAAFVKPAWDSLGWMGKSFASFFR